MKVIEIKAPGGPQVLQLGERPLPAAQDREVLIQVEAAGVNRPDVMQRQGLYPPPPGASDIPGLEVAGVIRAVGQQVRRFKVGDRVCALLSGGGYAEYAAAHEELCLPVPDHLSPIEAAAVPEAFFTVWHNLFQRASLQAGETLLVHGGSSGIGTTAILLGKAFGARVLVTAGSPEKCAACQKFGADLAINYRQEDFVARVRETTANRGADVILDMVGGDYIERNLQAAARCGRIAQIAFLQGAKTTVDFRLLLVKRLSLLGATLRRQSVPEKATIAAALRQHVWPLVEAGKLKPVIDSTFPLKQAGDAHRLMESSLHVGKIVLLV